MGAIRQIYLRLLSYDEARRKLLREIEQAFLEGVEEVEIIHGVGSYILAKMVREELAKISYVVPLDNSLHYNPGACRYQLLVPSKESLRRYLEK